MNYKQFSKEFSDLQLHDHVKLNNIMQNIESLKSKKFFDENDKDFIKLKEDYNGFKNQILEKALKLKKFFIENNKEFSDFLFQNCLSFYNYYSIKENFDFFTEKEYKKLDTKKLDGYLTKLNMLLNQKQINANKLNEELVKVKNEYNQVFDENIESSSLKGSRADSMRIRYNKTLRQYKTVSKMTNFIKKEINIIENVLTNDNTLEK